MHFVGLLKLKLVTEKVRNMQTNFWKVMYIFEVALAIVVFVVTRRNKLLR